jgi:hypothetical protein
MPGDAHAWVRLEDERPEVGVPVLVFLKDSSIDKIGDRYSVDYLVKMMDGRIAWDFFDDDEISHWQTLASPPA